MFLVYRAHHNEVLIQDWHYIAITVIIRIALINVHIYPLLLVQKMMFLRKMDGKTVRLLTE